MAILLSRRATLGSIFRRVCGQNPLFDAIAPVGPLDVTIRAQSRPSKVTLEPGDQTVPFEYRDKEIHLTVPTLEIHHVIVVR